MIEKEICKLQEETSSRFGAHKIKGTEVVRRIGELRNSCDIVRPPNAPISTKAPRRPPNVRPAEPYQARQLINVRHTNWRHCKTLSRARMSNLLIYTTALAALVSLALLADQTVGADVLPSELVRRQIKRQAEDVEASTQSSSTSTTSRPAKSKIPPVNFTQVDELFDAVFEEPEVLAKWSHMDKQLTNGKSHSLGPHLEPQQQCPV